MRVSQKVIQVYLRRLTAGRGGSAPQPMQDLTLFDADILGLKRRAENDGNLEWLRLSMESLILNPKGRIGNFVGETYPFREDEMVTLLTYAYSKIWPDKDLSQITIAPDISFVQMTEEEWLTNK